MGHCLPQEEVPWEEEAFGKRERVAGSSTSTPRRSCQAASAAGRPRAAPKPATAVLSAPQRRSNGRERRSAVSLPPPAAVDPAQLENLSKEAVSELLYPLIKARRSTLAGKITGMLLEGLDTDELAPLASSAALEAIGEALEVLIEADGNAEAAGAETAALAQAALSRAKVPARTAAGDEARRQRRDQMNWTSCARRTRGCRTACRRSSRRSSC